MELGPGGQKSARGVNRQCHARRHLGCFTTHGSSTANVCTMQCKAGM
jgi:hypothetical protein